MSASSQTLEQEVRDLRQDVAALRKALREEASKRQAGAAAAAAENVERLRTAAADAGTRAQERLEQLEEQIEANPVQSVLIALGVGFVIGRLLSR